MSTPCREAVVQNGLTFSLQHLTRTLCAIGESKGHNFIETGEFDLFQEFNISREDPRVFSTIHDRSHIVKDDQRSVNASDSVVADAGLDVGHPGVDKLGHGGQFESCTDSALDREGRMVGEQSGMARGVGQAVSTMSRWS